MNETHYLVIPRADVTETEMHGSAAIHLAALGMIQPDPNCGHGDFGWRLSTLPEMVEGTGTFNQSRYSELEAKRAMAIFEVTLTIDEDQVINWDDIQETFRLGEPD